MIQTSRRPTTLVGQEIAEAIRDVVKSYDVKILGVIPHQSLSTDFDEGRIGYFRTDRGHDALASARLSRVIRVLYGKDADPEKLTFLFSPLQTLPNPQGSIFQYIHSKVFIIDDAFCTIGSMNFNRRSTTHDSELSLGFHEPNSKGDGFAKRLRLRLWQNHLGLTASGLYLIDDPVESIATVWSQIKELGGRKEIQAPGGRKWNPNVVRYNWSSDLPLGTAEHFADPLGIGITNETEWVDKVTDPIVSSGETTRLPKR